MLIAWNSGVPAASGENPSPPAILRPAPTAIDAPIDRAAELRLKQGIDHFDLGDFDNAIWTLANSREIWSGTLETRIRAHKYLAFSYCVQNRVTLCRLHFDKAFALDPQFDLLPGERGHPLWGPVFEKAKRREGASPDDVFNHLKPKR